MTMGIHKPIKCKLKSKSMKGGSYYGYYGVRGDP